MKTLNDHLTLKRQLLVFPLQAIMKLIEFGANVNYPDLLGHTPLFYACNATELRNVILLLIHNGAKIGLKDHDGNTILHQVFTWTTNTPPCRQ